MRRAGEEVACELGGRSYGFRTPDLYDPAKARRVLARQGVRRPSATEFRVAAAAGIEAIARTAGDEAEGERQKLLLDEWYKLIEPVDEDSIDEPDPMKRGEELLRRQTERQERLRALLPDVNAIEANLERHWPPYSELVEDRTYWDDVSRIEIVRLLLQRIDGVPLERDEDGMLTDTAYRSIPHGHRMPLATFAFRMLAPDEAQRKN